MTMRKFMVECWLCFAYPCATSVPGLYLAGFTGYQRLQAEKGHCGRGDGGCGHAARTASVQGLHRRH